MNKVHCQFISRFYLNLLNSIYQILSYHKHISDGKFSTIHQLRDDLKYELSLGLNLP